MKNRFLAVLLLGLILGFSTFANASLIDRGNGLIYDTDYNITWLQNVNTTPMNWSHANAWAASITVNSVGGWRLPSSFNRGGTSICSGQNCILSEMGHLYYTELGNDTILETPLRTGPFTNLIAYPYWSATDATAVGRPDLGWRFGWFVGIQTAQEKDYTGYALAVHDGDVGGSTSVPVPSAILLLAPGLAAFFVVRRRFMR